MENLRSLWFISVIIPAENENVIELIYLLQLHNELEVNVISTQEASVMEFAL